MIFANNIIDIVKSHKQNNTVESIPNMLFHGNSLSLINEYVRSICIVLNETIELRKNPNILIIDCIFNSSIINIRNNVQHFIKSQYNKKHGFKIIIFNHLDELSDEAQCALRVLMEQNTSNLFIGIASRLNHIVEPVVSRMMTVGLNSYNKIPPQHRQPSTKVIEKRLYDYKYGVYTHWLFVPSERSMDIIIGHFYKVVDAINKLPSLTAIERLFKQAEGSILRCIQSPDVGGLLKQTCLNPSRIDRRLFICHLLTNHLVLMKNIK